MEIVADYLLTKILNPTDNGSCIRLCSGKTCRAISINNFEYEIGSVLFQGFSDATDLPILLQIEKILLIDNVNVICCSHLTVVAFNSALNSFQVESEI